MSKICSSITEITIPLPLTQLKMFYMSNMFHFTLV